MPGTPTPSERRRAHQCRRAPASRGGPAGAQHHRHDLRRRPRRSGLRRRPPAGLHLVEHGDLSRGRARRDAPARTDRVPRQPAADGVDAPRPAVEWPRRPDHRARRARRRALWPAPAALRADREGRSRRGPATAYAITRRLWSDRTVAEQPLLVVWEVLGHLDLLLDAGAVTEQVTDDGSRRGLASFALAPAPATAPATHLPGFRFRDPRNHEPAGGGGHVRAGRHAQRRR